MKRIEFNKYMDIISYNNDIIIFNKLNSAIVLMDKNRIKNNNGKYFCDITEEEFEDFKENDFFFSSEEVQKYIESNMKFPVETNEVEITISVTEKCNLLCEYCYQESWNKEESIGKKELKTKVLNYISAILPKIEQPNSVISIHFIGGEPLLEQEVILEIVDEIQNINANPELFTTLPRMWLKAT